MTIPNDLIRRTMKRILDEDEAHQRRLGLIPDQLQVRYPVPRRRGEERSYKLTNLLTDDEIGWNVARLRKAGGRANCDHADKLEAWNEQRKRNGVLPESGGTARP
jgi:hypothetical protein